VQQAGQLSLFTSGGQPPWLGALRADLKRWTQQGVFFGTSSWKYKGWLGQIYSRDLYCKRGKFSAKLFDQECLREYAETFPTVCADFAFYQFYPDAFWRRLFAQVPPTFLFGFKAPERITCPVFPNHARYGARAGRANDDFLNAELVRAEFLDRLAPFGQQVGYLVFEFPQFPRPTKKSCLQFVARLDAFLAQLPRQFAYGVEIRTKELLGDDYFDCLRQHGVAHVFNSWTRMPTIGAQARMPHALTADVVISRVLLKPGRQYEAAVRRFYPYSEVRDPDPEGRAQIAQLVNTSVTRKVRCFIAVNNRYEGNAIATIRGILQALASNPVKTENDCH
jgi:uncharacterized protein YecE (DUF72 family)